MSDGVSTYFICSFVFLHFRIFTAVKTKNNFIFTHSLTFGFENKELTYYFIYISKLLRVPVGNIRRSNNEPATIHNISDVLPECLEFFFQVRKQA
jgi:hypothetical protein